MSTGLTGTGGAGGVCLVSIINPLVGLVEEEAVELDSCTCLDLSLLFSPKLLLIKKPKNKIPITKNNALE